MHAARNDPADHFWDSLISPNHNEIVITDERVGTVPPPAAAGDPVWDWFLSPNHSEIVVDDRS